MTNAELFKKITEKMYEVYKAKNADYGDSFNITRNEYPNAILIRLQDKFLRLKQLYRNNFKANVQNESIKDTLMDMANYCILELIAITEQENINKVANSGKYTMNEMLEVQERFEKLNRKLQFMNDMRNRDKAIDAQFIHKYNSIIEEMMELQSKYLNILSYRTIPPKMALVNTKSNEKLYARSPGSEIYKEIGNAKNIHC